MSAYAIQSGINGIPVLTRRIHEVSVHQNNVMCLAPVITARTARVHAGGTKAPTPQRTAYTSTNKLVSFTSDIGKEGVGGSAVTEFPVSVAVFNDATAASEQVATVDTHDSRPQIAQSSPGFHSTLTSGINVDGVAAGQAHEIEHPASTMIDTVHDSAKLAESVSKSLDNYPRKRLGLLLQSLESAVQSFAVPEGVLDALSHRDAQRNISMLREVLNSQTAAIHQTTQQPTLPITEKQSIDDAEPVASVYAARASPKRSNSVSPARARATKQPSQQQQQQQQQQQRQLGSAQSVLMDATAKLSIMNMVHHHYADSEGYAPSNLRWSESLRDYATINACDHCDGQGAVVKHADKTYTVASPLRGAAEWKFEGVGEAGKVPLKELVNHDTQTEESTLYKTAAKDSDKSLVYEQISAPKHFGGILKTVAAKADASVRRKPVVADAEVQAAPTEHIMTHHQVNVPTAYEHYDAAESLHVDIPSINEAPTLRVPQLNDALPLLAFNEAPSLPSLPSKCSKEAPWRSSMRSPSVSRKVISDVIASQLALPLGVVGPDGGRPKRLPDVQTDDRYHRSIQPTTTAFAPPPQPMPPAYAAYNRATTPNPQIPSSNVVVPGQGAPAVARQPASGMARSAKMSDTQRQLSQQRNISPAQAIVPDHSPSPNRVAEALQDLNRPPTPVREIQTALQGSPVLASTVGFRQSQVQHLDEFHCSPSEEATVDDSDDELACTFTPILRSIQDRITALRKKCEGDTEMLSVRERVLDELYLIKLQEEHVRQQRILERRKLERKAAHIAAAVVGAKIREQNKNLGEAKRQVQEAFRRHKHRSTSASRRRTLSMSSKSDAEMSVAPSEATSRDSGAAQDAGTQTRDGDTGIREGATRRASFAPNPPPMNELRSPLFQNVSHVLYARRELLSSGLQQASVFSADGPLGSVNTTQALAASYKNGLTGASRMSPERHQAGAVPASRASDWPRVIGDLTASLVETQAFHKVAPEISAPAHVSDKTLAEKEAEVNRLYSQLVATNY